MKIDLIECTVQMNLGGNPNLMTAVKAGHSAVLATEIPLLRLMHDPEGGEGEECSIGEARKVGEVETTKNAELERLHAIYKKAAVDLLYPAGRGFPLKLADCELPLSSLSAQAVPRSNPDRQEATAKVA